MTMDVKPVVPPPGAVVPGPGVAVPRWMKLALAASLAVNLGVMGLVAGSVLKDGPPHRALLAAEMNFGPFTEALTKADRAELRRGFLAAAPDLRDQRRQMRAEFSGLLALLRAEPFDAGALRAALEAQQARTLERFEIGRGLMFARISAMTPAERVAFAERLEQGMARGPKDRRGAAPGG